jgi:tetratricopeptide (TPR) repeat protein
MVTLDDAIDKLKKGDHEGGMVILQRLREADPDDPDILYNLGMIYSDMELLDKAIETLGRCVEIRGNAHDRTALGVAYMRNKQSEEALRELEAAIAADPDDFHARKNYGAVLGQLGRTDESIAAFTKAAAVNPQAPEVAYGLGRAYETKGELERADEWYQKVLAMPGVSEMRELAKDGRTRIAESGMKRHGVNMAAVFYIVDALETYDGLSRDEVQKIAFDVALLGQRGLDINDPEKKYRVKSLPEVYSGLHMLCYMYVGFKIIDPDLDAGIDLKKEYETALAMHGGETE